MVNYPSRPDTETKAQRRRVTFGRQCQDTNEETLTPKPARCHPFTSDAAPIKQVDIRPPWWPHNREVSGGKHDLPFWPEAVRNPSLKEVLKGLRGKAHGGGGGRMGRGEGGKDRAAR